MNKKYIMTIICLVMTAFILAGCVKDVGKTDSSPSNKSDDETIVYNTSFSGMPNISSDNVTAYVSGDTVIFEYINSGLDSFTAQLVSYSLREDKVLGQVNLGEGNFQISLTEDGFIVFDLMKGLADYYDNACSKTDSATFFEVNTLYFAKSSSDGKYILAQNYSNGELLVYNTETKLTTTLKKNIIVETAEYYDGKFYLMGTGAYVLEPENNHFYSISDKLRTYDVGKEYVFGNNGSYIVLLSTQKSDDKMINIDERQGSLIDAGDYGCVTVDYADNKSQAVFYDTQNSCFAQFSTEGMISCVEQISKNSAIIVTKNSDNVFEYSLLDISKLKKNDFKTEPLNHDAINGVEELPDYSGESKTVQLIKQLENDYGVRVMYGEDIFSVSELGFEIMGTDENTAYNYMLKFEDYFDYYPKGLLKEAGLGRPLVLYLCDKIKNNVEGLSIYIGGYNVIYMQVGGKDEYFFSSLTHEVGHALENGIDTELIAGWTELMPTQVIKAYGDGIDGISVEYTPDDKGKTPVWFRDVYGRSNEKEDRATIFQGMYDSYVENDEGIFKYDGLKKKKDYWSYMLRETFESCKGVSEFNWDK